MKAQKPAVGILENPMYEGCKMYTVECSCTDPDHTHTITVTNEVGEVQLILKGTYHYPIWRKNRWKGIFNLLFRGRYEVDFDILLNEQAATNYITAIKTAMKDLKESPDHIHEGRAE